MHSSLHLIARANAFLDKLALGSGSPVILRRKLESSLRVLTQLKEEMIFHGFAAPFIGITRAMPPDEFASAEEARDLSKQIARMRYIASLKKFTLARTRIAIAAHKVALGELEHSLRPELLQVLPLDGNYIARLVASREHGLHAYHVLTELLASNAEQENVSVVIEHNRNGARVRTRFVLASVKNIEDRVKRSFGEDARIISIKPHPARAAIKRRSARTCLAAAYAVLAASQIERELASAEVPAEVMRYASIMRKHGLAADAVINESEEYEKVAAELASEGLLRYEQGEPIVVESVASFIARRRHLLRERTVRRAKELLGLDLLKFFLLIPRRERERGLLFPSLPALLSKENLAPFDELFSMHGIENASDIIWTKFRAEELGLNLDGKSLGSAVFYLNSDKPVEWCEKNFGLPRERILAAARTLAPLVEAREERLRELGIEKSARAREFAEALRDAGAQGKKG
ncbi:MAG: DUF530 family protein [Candidatus Micrarchaeia archaeon]